MKIDIFDCNCSVDIARENFEEAKAYLEQREVDYFYLIFDNVVEFSCIGSKRNVKIFDNVGKRFGKPLDKSAEM